MSSIIATQGNAKVFKQKYQISEPIVLFLGQHYPYKGYQQFLAAMSLVWQKVPETHFVFIGHAVGQSENYFTQFIEPRIHHLGSVTLQEKTDALAACILLCVPSTQESFGGVYTEAWSFAKPVIGCNIPAVSEVINHGIDGYLVSQIPLEIAEAICQILMNPIHAEKMGLAGKAKVDLRFSWKHLAKQIEAVYEKLI